MKHCSNTPSKPLIITLEMEQEQQRMLNALRTQHFPAHANYLDAHITLFYRLPSNQSTIQETLKLLAQMPPLLLNVSQVKQAHHWVAYHIQSPPLQQLHQQMQQAFQPWLCKQDTKTLSPHITLLNKTTAFKAQLLYQQLQQNFVPFQINTTGFKTWLYRKGPWKAQEFYPFLSESHSNPT